MTDDDFLSSEFEAFTNMDFDDMPGWDDDTEFIPRKLPGRMEKITELLDRAVRDFKVMAVEKDIDGAELITIGKYFSDAQKKAVEAVNALSLEQQAEVAA